MTNKCECIICAYNDFSAMHNLRNCNDVDVHSLKDCQVKSLEAGIKKGRESMQEDIIIAIKSKIKTYSHEDDIHILQSIISTIKKL